MNNKSNTLNARVKIGFVLGILAMILFSIKDCDAQDVIYTKQGGIIKQITLTSNDGDTLKYIYNKSGQADYILMEQVKEYKKNTTDDILTPEYREKQIAKQIGTTTEVTPSETKKSNAGNLLIKAGNHYTAMVVTPVIIAIVVAVLSFGGAPILALAAVSIGGSVIQLVHVVKFIRSIKGAGEELNRLEDSLGK